MKHIFNILGCVLLGGAALVACQVEEPVGPAPVGDVNVNPGYLRAEVEFDAPADAQIARVFFNMGKYADFELEAAGPQKFLIEDIAEGDQKINVITFNATGVKSDPKGVQTHIYGPKYEGSIANRDLIEMTALGANVLEFYFADASKDETELRVVYHNTSGKKDSVVVAPTVNTVKLDNIDMSKAYYYYTVCVPCSNCIDEFFTKEIDAFKAAKKSFNKAAWVCSATNLVDNDDATYWRAGSAALPAVVEIDMNADKVFDKISFIQSNADGGSLAKRVTVEASSDKTNWTTLLNNKTLALNLYCQSYPIPETEARYIKITVNETTSNKPVQFAEFDLANDMKVSGENGIAAPEFKNAGPLVKYDPDKIVGGPNFGTRFYQAIGWTHTTDGPSADNTGGSADNCTAAICFFAAAPWGVPDFENAKCFQTFDLLPGDYEYIATSGDGDCWSEYWVGYAAAGKGNTLPDQSALSTDPNSLGAVEVTTQHTAYKVPFTLTQRTTVSLGFVYSTYSTKRYNDTGSMPWAQNYFSTVELKVIDLQ